MEFLYFCTIILDVYMSTESIIGVVSGIIGIVGGIIGIVKFADWIRKRLNSTTNELFKQVLDRNLTDTDHRKYLKKLNKNTTDRQ